MTGKRTMAVAMIVAGAWTLRVLCVQPGDSKASAAPPVVAPDVKSGDPNDLPELTAAYAKLEEALKRLPREQFDPAAIIEQVGRDPDRLFQWVRDKTDLLPYRGALRGPAGVLMDRGGNSLDRSLLLAQLLESAGYKVRLANAALPDDQVRQLLSRVNRRVNQVAVDDSEASDEVKAARLRVARHAEKLLAIVGDAASGPAVAEAAQAAALADHWWVQRQAGGRWVDLDPTLPEAGPGQSPLQPKRTVGVPLPGGKPALDPADCHEVELRIVIEAWRADQLRTATVLRHVLRPAQTLDRSLRFGHVTGNGTDKTNAKASDAVERQKLKKDLVQEELYLPVLWIDDRPITEASFTTTGAVDLNPKRDPAGRLAGSAGKTLAGLNDSLGGGESSVKDTGVLTAQWIEYELRVPGEPPLTVRREVFDLLGPLARSAGIKQAPTLTDADKLRRALMLAGQTRILLQPCALRPMFLQDRLARSSIKQKPIWMAMARGEINTREKLARALDKLVAPDVVTTGFAIARDGISPVSGRVFIDRPNIIHHRVWFEEGSESEIVSREGIDLAFTSTAGLGAEAFKSRLVQGVADTLAEHLVFSSRAASGENTVVVFEASAEKGVKPVAVRPADALAVCKLGLTADGQARALQDLSAGQVLVLAGVESGRWTWWRVDPRTGQTVGVMENGFHGDLTERATLEAELDAMQPSLLRRVTSKELENMHRQDVWRLAKGNKEVAADLYTLQQDLLGIAARMSRLLF